MASAAETVRTKLNTIEAARGLAALAVVLFHANASAGYIGHATFPLLSLGEHGVDFFFVLSGFIIFFVHLGDIGKPEKARDYAIKRFIRLFPLLWLVAGSWIALRAALELSPGLASIGTSLFLYPSLVEPVPMVVWTLRHEALFYCAFLVLIVSRGAGLALFGLWTLAVLGQLILSLLGQPIGGMASFFLSSYQLDFVLGAAVAYLHRRRSFAPAFWPLLISVAFLIALFTVQEKYEIARANLLDYVSVAATAWTVVLGLAFAGILHGLLCVETKVRVPKGLILLGAASYAIYLVHTPLNSFTQRVAVHLPTGASHLFMILCGVIGGIALHLLFERPVSRFLRSRLLGSRRPQSETPSLA